VKKNSNVVAASSAPDVRIASASEGVSLPSVPWVSSEYIYHGAQFLGVRSSAREREGGRERQDRQRASVQRIARASKVTSHLPIQDGRRPAGGWFEEDHRQRENAEGKAERGDRGKCDDKGSKWP